LALQCEHNPLFFNQENTGIKSFHDRVSLQIGQKERPLAIDMSLIALYERAEAKLPPTKPNIINNMLVDIFIKVSV